MRHCWCVLNTGEPANKTFNGCHSAMGSVSFSLLLFSILGNQLRPGESGKVGRRGSRQEQIFRPLVPQLLPNYSTPALPPASEVSCMMAAISCNYRAGCGSALRQYRESCASLVEGTTSACSVSCQHALVGLISTAEGERLMDCTCQNPDCSLEKKRVEPCREEVTWQTAPGTVVPCSAATAICQANPECDIALLYFNSNCRELFGGGRCSDACRNSAQILARQKAAAKLATCTCDRSGFLDCAMIRESTRTFCFTNEIVQEKGDGAKLRDKSIGLLQIIQLVLTISVTFCGATIRRVFKALVDV